MWEINTHLYLSHPRQLSVVGAGAVQDAESGTEAGEPENNNKKRMKKKVKSEQQTLFNHPISCSFLKQFKALTFPSASRRSLHWPPSPRPPPPLPLPLLRCIPWSDPCALLLLLLHQSSPLRGGGGRGSWLRPPRRFRPAPSSSSSSSAPSSAAGASSPPLHPSLAKRRESWNKLLYILNVSNCNSFRL